MVQKVTTSGGVDLRKVGTEGHRRYVFFMFVNGYRFETLRGVSVRRSFRILGPFLFLPCYVRRTKSVGTTGHGKLGEPFTGPK